VFSTLFAEAGIVEVHHLEHLLPVAQALLLCPPMHGDSVAIVGSGGGHSTVFTDEIAAAGFNVPMFSDATQSKLRAQLPAWAPVRNPVDMTGAYTSNPGLFASMTELVMTGEVPFDGAVNYGLYGMWRDGEVEAGSPYDYVTAAPLLGQIQQKLTKPIIFYTPYANRSHKAFTAMRESGVPCLDDMRTASVALSALRQRSRFLSQGSEATARSLNRSTMLAPDEADLDTEAGAYRFLSTFGVKVPELRTASSVEEAVSAADAIGFPIVIKAILPGIPHKSDVGGVHVGIYGPTQAREAAERITSDVTAALDVSALSGFLITPDLGRQREFFIGVRRDSALSALGLIGIGGVLVEVLNDVAVCLLPATPERVARAVDRLASGELWRGMRGGIAVSPDKVANLLNQLHVAVMSRPDLESIECNPTMLVGSDLIPVDAAIARRRRHAQ
jgi:acetyltransferase